MKTDFIKGTLIRLKLTFISTFWKININILWYFAYMHHAAELYNYFILVPFAQYFYFASNRNLKINTTNVFIYHENVCFCVF